MTWVVLPHAGLDDLWFGMAREEVAAILDPMHRVTSASTLVDGTLSEIRSMTTPVCNYQDGRSRCIDTHWSMAPLMLDGVDLFAMESGDLLAALERRNGGAIEIVGIVYFLKLGLAVCNYVDKHGRVYPPFDEDQDHRGIGMFRPGAHDAMLSHARA